MGFGAVLVVLAEHRAGLGLEAAHGVVEVLEAIGLDLEDRLEIVLGEDRVVVGVVVGGVRVLARAGLRERSPGILGRVAPSCRGTSCARRSGRSRTCRLDLVARAGLDGIWTETMLGKPVADDDDPQAVRERSLHGREGEDVARAPAGAARAGEVGRARDRTRAAVRIITFTSGISGCRPARARRGR